MKIALLTNLVEEKTGHINIGDVFIGVGLKHLLNHALKEIGIKKPEFVKVSRFKVLDEKDKKILASCDFIVYAGMPQYNNLDDWKFYYDIEIWDELIKIGKPVLRLAGGGGYPSETWTPAEFSNHLSSSKLTTDTLEKTKKIVKFFTTRDKMAQKFLANNNTESVLLPCSGTFACYSSIAMDWIKPKSYHAICITAHFMKGRNDEEHLIEEIKKTKEYLESLGKPCKILAQVPKNDKEYLEKHFDEVVSFDCTSDYINFYKGVDICVTTRLHCALPIFGVNGRVILIRVDTRAVAGEECGIPVIPLYDFELEKVQDIVENDKFSKFLPEELFIKSVNVYKEMFKELK